MPIATQKLTFQEYLTVCETSEDRYELVHGELQRMPPPSWLHYRIAKFLERAFDREISRLAHPWETFREPGQQTEADTSRLPDVSVIPTEAIEDCLDQSAILTVAAILVVEVVSDGTALQDYREKVSEYQTKGIREYWIVDPDPFGAAKYIGSPKRPTVSIYALVDGTYQVARFQGSDRVISLTFPDLLLTAEQILGAGRQI
jgi:Uma2 family endonuclease